MQSLPLNRFKRCNEAVSPELLSDDELTKLEDCVLDKELGRPKKRFNWAKFNTNAIGGVIHSLYDVKADGGNNYIIGGYGTTVKVSADGTGTWGSAISGLAGIAKFQLSPYAGKFYLTDGVIAPKVLGGTTLADTWSLEITAPDISSVETGHHASGNLTASTCYKWAITYVTAEGIESPPSQPITHQISSSVLTSTDGTYKCVGFRGLPVSSDTRVIARRIYRTLADSEVYYFNSQIDNIITAWYDVLADSDLGSEGFNYLNAPQTAKYTCVHKERLWLANQTRKVKCWTTPSHSKALTAITAIIINGVLKSFTSGIGIKNGAITNPGGSLTAGYYTYRFVFFDENGIMSDVIDSNEIQVTTGDYVNIYGVPRVASYYKGVASGKVYRKYTVASGGAGTFYYIADYTPGTPITDRANFEDKSYTAGDAYVTNQTTDTENTGVSFSDVGKPPYFILEDIRDIYPDDGDQIVNIFDDVNGVLIAKENSWCKIYTEGSSQNWRLVKILSNIGAEENTISKWGSEYVFIHNKKCYKFNSQSGQLEDLGELKRDSLNSVSTFHSAARDKSWYVLGVSGGGLTSAYGFLVYDFVVQSWYSFNVYDIPYASEIKKHGSSAGSILIASGQYVLYYGTGTLDENTALGTQVDITPIIKTKTFNLGDGISLIRIRKIKFNYLKLDGKSCIIAVVNGDSLLTNTHTDSTNATDSTDFKTFETDTGGEGDNFKKCNKVYFQFSGAGITEFSVFRFQYRLINEGKQNV